MNFCSICGSGKLLYTIPQNDNLPRYCCTKCNTIHYQNPNIIVGGICVWENKILLAKRNIEPRKNFWNLPCGFLENNETIKDGARREIVEETGASVRIANLQTVYNILHTNQVYLIFVAHMLSSKFLPETAESSSVKLFDLNNIPYEQIAFSANVFALKQFVQNPTSQEVYYGHV